MSDYMDYPFVCDEKTGDRCLKQCETCKAWEQRRHTDKDWPEKERRESAKSNRSTPFSERK